MLRYDFQTKMDFYDKTSSSGHTATVTVLRYDASGTKLVSGSLDTHVILWDVVSECGLYRLKGHKGQLAS